MPLRNHRVSWTRRQLLLGTGASLAAIALPAGRRAAAVGAAPTVIRARPGDAQLLPAGEPQTAVWGFGGTVPGPVLRVRQGDTVRVRLENELPQPTTIHWHGIRIENAMDGVAGLTQEAVPSGGRFDYAFTVPDAGTFWYHPHNLSWEQVARGLYGLLIVDEASPPAVDQDIALVFDDWRLDEAGQIHEASFGAMMDWSHAGRLGNTLTINGQDLMDIPVSAGQRMRLRVCNTANARILNLRFEEHAHTVIAIDGQPVPPFALEDGAMALMPGQRVDLIADMTLNPGAEAAITEVTGGGRLVAGRFVYDAQAVTRATPLDPPAGLAANPLSEKLDLANAQDVTLRMEGGAMGRMQGATFRGQHLGMRELVAQGKVWAFNGQAGMTDRPLFDAPLGRTVRLAMVNDTNWPHALHFHGHHVREIARSQGSVRKDAWRDTVMVDRGETVTVAFVADNPGKWMLHCHMLEHQAGGMATWFRVSA